MSKNKQFKSPFSEQMCNHYASGYEAGRLHSVTGKLDRERTRELIRRFLPAPPATILDVGGGPGGHACSLSWEKESSLLGMRAHLMAEAKKT